MGTIDVSYIRKTAEQIQTLRTELKQIGADLPMMHTETGHVVSRLEEQIDKHVVRMGAMCKVLLAAADLYEENERHIEDVFDLEYLPLVDTQFGTSRFFQLQAHEKLMPIQKGKRIN